MCAKYTTNERPDGIEPGYCWCGCGSKTSGPLVRYARHHTAKQKRMPPEERFWSKVDKSGGPDACWMWRGSTSGQMGYGDFESTHPPIRMGAHVYSYILAHGPFDKGRGLHVMHACDNPKCVNPAHLSLGTPADNIHDMHKKGRAGYGARYGEDSHWAKLTNEQAEEIRKLYATGEWTQVELGKKFGALQVTISQIVLRKTYNR